MWWSLNVYHINVVSEGLKHKRCVKTNINSAAKNITLYSYTMYQYSKLSYNFSKFSGIFLVLFCFFLFNLGGGKSSKGDMITDLEFCPQVELTMRTVVHFRPITFWLCCTFFFPLSFLFLPFCAKFTFALKLVKMQSVGIFIVYF